MFADDCLMPDLASKIDICARINLFTVIDGRLHYFLCKFPQFYLPSETVFNGDERMVVDRYQKWDNLGFLDVHEGAETDLRLVASGLN